MMESVVKDMDKLEAEWKDVMEFGEETLSFAGEDWLTFRNKLYKFEDSLKAWSTRYGYWVCNRSCQVPE